MGLGAIAVTPLDMASAYATIAAGGVYSKPMAIRKVVLPNGAVDDQAGWGTPDRKRVITDGVAYEVTRILEENVVGGTGVGARLSDRVAAGKTGTTDNHADAWFCGFTPQLEATVWVGYPRAEIPMTSVHGIAVAGGTFPATIWHQFMAAALWKSPPLEFPQPKRYPTFISWHGQWAYAGGGYDSSASSTSATTTGAATTGEGADAFDAPFDAAADDRPAASDHCSVTTEPPPATTEPPPPRRLSRSAALVAGAAALCLTAAAAYLAWPAESPLVPLHAGHAIGDREFSRWFYALVGGGFALYVAGVWFARRRAPRFAHVAVVAVAMQLAPLGAPLLLSTDAWTYWDYGRLAAVHGENPYRDDPESAHADPAFRYVGAAWRDTTSVYGPVFTLASEPIARAAGTSADAAAWIYKTLAAFAVLAAAFLAARVARRPALALAFVGWNPLLAVHFAGGGHNDAWVAALVAGALAASAAPRPQLAGVCWALGILVKWVPLLLLPLRALEARATGRRVGHLGFALTFVAAAALATWRYGLAWLGALGPLARNAGHETRYAMPHRLASIGVPHSAAIVACAAAFVVAYAWLLREAWRGRARLGLATGLAPARDAVPRRLVVVWSLPLAAAEDDEPAALLGLVLCAYLLKQTIPL